MKFLHFFPLEKAHPVMRTVCTGHAFDYRKTQVTKATKPKKCEKPTDDTIFFNDLFPMSPLVNPWVTFDGDRRCQEQLPNLAVEWTRVPWSVCLFFFRLHGKALKSLSWKKATALFFGRFWHNLKFHDFFFVEKGEDTWNAECTQHIPGCNRHPRLSHEGWS